MNGYELPRLACAYRRGAGYVPQSVARLRSSADLHVRSDYAWDFVCVTNEPDHPLFAQEDIVTVPMLNDFPGWWCTTELFRLKGPVVVVGLDTVFVGDITPLFEMAVNCPSDEFYMIRPFNPREKWASGIMIWNGDWEWMFSSFNPSIEIPLYDLEQRRVWDKIEGMGLTIRCVQDEFLGVYSYKHHCRSRGRPPKDARVILFHGQPRPDQCSEPWIRRNQGEI